MIPESKDKDVKELKDVKPVSEDKKETKPIETIPAKPDVSKPEEKPSTIPSPLPQTNSEKTGVLSNNPEPGKQNAPVVDVKSEIPAKAIPKTTARKGSYPAWLK